MVNRKNKKGFTLIEMIIVMALTVLTISVVSSVFFMGNTVFSSADSKTTLQMEKQDIEHELSKINMQATGISEIKIGSGSISGSRLDEWIDADKYSSVNEISIKYVDAEKQDNHYIYKDKHYKFSIEENGKITVNGVESPVYTLTMTEETENIKKTLSRNVLDFKVKPNDKDGLIFDILLKKRSFKEVNELNVNFAVSFRNRNSALDGA